LILAGVDATAVEVEAITYGLARSRAWRENPKRQMFRP
jgi:hypothetical protein